jgi:hypothetical protein
VAVGTIVTEVNGGRSFSPHGQQKAKTEKERERERERDRKTYKEKGSGSQYFFQGHTPNVLTPSNFTISQQ